MVPKKWRAVTLGAVCCNQVWFLDLDHSTFKGF